MILYIPGNDDKRKSPAYTIDMEEKYYMKLGDKKPQKIPMYVYYIIVGVIIVLLNLLVVPAVQERSIQKTDYSTFIKIYGSDTIFEKVASVFLQKYGCDMPGGESVFFSWF